jgi:hypothetical protein
MQSGFVFVVLTFSSSWPPTDAVELFRQAIETEGCLTIMADAEGCLRTRLEHAGAVREFVSVPIHFTGTGDAGTTVGVTWSDTGNLKLYLHGLPLAERGTAEAVMIRRSGKRGASASDRVFLTLDPGCAQSEPEAFFLASIDDLDKKLASEDEYSLIRAGGLLRQLLLDGLIDRANQTHRLRIEYEVRARQNPFPIAVDYEFGAIDPGPYPGAPTKRVDVKQLLGTWILKSPAGPASVRDLVRVWANTKGGVDFGKARTAQEHILVDWDEAIQMFGREGSFDAMVGVGKVVLTGLVPLALKIQSTT